MSYQVLSRQAHQYLRLRSPEQRWEFARERGFVGLVVAELVEAVRFMPVVFRQQENKASLVGLLGFGAQNFFVDPAGKWRTPYIPGILRAWPFALVPKDDQQVVVIERDSGFFDTNEGERLFSPEGNQSEVLARAVEFLKVMAQQEIVTQRGVESIRKLNLLTPWEPVVQRGEERVRLQGLFAIDQKAFGELSEEDFLTLRREGGLPIVYASILSMRSITVLEQLARLQKPAAAPVIAPAMPDFTDDYLKF